MTNSHCSAAEMGGGDCFEANVEIRKTYHDNETNNCSEQKYMSVSCPQDIQKVNKSQDENTLIKKSTTATTTTTMIDEAKLLFQLAIPTVGVQLCLVLVSTETASVIGRYLTNEELAAFSLANLTGNLLCQSFILGISTASETLSPLAYTLGNYEEVGRLAIRGYVTGIVVLSPLISLLCTLMGQILIGFHQDVTSSILASKWIRVYVLGLPFALCFRDIQRFLTCQHIVLPLLYSGLISCLVIHPFLLRILVPSWLGFIGSALAVVTTQISTVSLILLYMKIYKPHHPRTWPGLKRLLLEDGHTLKLGAIIEYMRLGFGGILGFSEWWFWETACFIAGKIGVVPLCVHTIAYQLIPLTYMLSRGIGIGLTVRVGSLIATDVPKAKRLVLWTLLVVIILSFSLSYTVYILQDRIVDLFTKDYQVKQGCKLIWNKVSIFIIFDSLFAINSSILNALGLQIRKALVTILCLWCVAIPVIYKKTIKQNGGIDVLWGILPIMYGALNVGLILCYILCDWNYISLERIQGSENTTKVQIMEQKGEEQRAWNIDRDISPLIRKAKEKGYVDAKDDEDEENYMSTTIGNSV